MSDKLDFLDGDSPAVSETAPTASQPSSDGLTRGPDGKFVAADAAPAPASQSAPEAALTPQPAPQPDTVPLSVLMAMKDEIKGLKEQLRQPAQPQEPPEPVYIDPDVENQLLQMKLNTSEESARDKYGDELVEAAKIAAIERFKQSPAWQSEVLVQRNPYRHVVEWYQREQALAEISDPAEVAAFKAWKAAQAAAPAAQNTAAATAAAPAASQNPLPRSLASAPAAGGVQTVPSGPGVAFDNVIK